MENPIFRLGTIMLASAALLTACQKQIAETSAPRQAELMSATSCQSCIENWPASNEKLSLIDYAPTPDKDYGSRIEVEQEGGKLKTLLLTIAPGFATGGNIGFNKISYRVTYMDADDMSNTKVLLQHADPNAAGGKVTSRDLFLTKAGGAVPNTSPSVNDPFFPAGWDMCDQVKIEILEMSGQGIPANENVIQTATYYLFELCCNIQVGDYVTYSQGYYMNPSPQTTPGKQWLLDHPELGPVTIGCEEGNTETYTTEQITMLGTGNSTYPGVLGRQIITMTLNVNASKLGLLGTETDLGCLTVVADGDAETTLDDMFAGMTVNQILAEANNAWGECDSNYSAEDLTAILKMIVDNFHEGTVNGGLLTCGTCSE